MLKRGGLLGSYSTGSKAIVSSIFLPNGAEQDAVVFERWRNTLKNDHSPTSMLWSFPDRPLSAYLITTGKIEV